MALQRTDVEGELERTNHDDAVAAGQAAVIRCVAPSAHAAGATALLARSFDVPTVVDESGIDPNFPFDNSTYYEHYYSTRLRSFDPLDPRRTRRHRPPFDDRLGDTDAFARSSYLEEPFAFDPGARGFAELGALPADSLRGDALVEGRSLRLTLGDQRERSSTGSLVLARAHMAPAAVVRHFEASFEMSMDGHLGGGGRGLSFCYGLPPEGNTTFGEDGTRSGLNVHFLTIDLPCEGAMCRSTAYNQLEVTYDGVLVDSQPLGTALRERSWVNVTIRFDAFGLTATHNGRRRLVSLPIFGYAPTAAWHFSMGARAGPFGDTHRVDNLRLRSGELLREGVVPLSISVNGLDFTPVHGGYRYVTVPVISAASPASGPASGGTLVTVSGFGFGSSTQLECRFQGAVTYATLLNSSAARCATPLAPRLNVSRPDHPIWAPHLQSVELAVSLHGQWEPSTAIATLPWLLRAPPVVSGFSPVTGPLAGGTLVTLTAFALAGGVDYRCRFGHPSHTVTATYDNVSEALLCVAPASAAIGALEVTLNGQQYTSSALLFSQHPPFALTTLEPPRGAALGGSYVHVSFDALGQPFPFEQLRCRVGEAPPREPLQATRSWALCVAPPSYESRALALEHTLDFSDPNMTEDGTVRLAVSGDAKVADGVLMLTVPSPETPHLSARDKIVSRANGIGSAVLTLRRPYNALHWFELSFELLMGSQLQVGGYGLSVSLGELDTARVRECMDAPPLWYPSGGSGADGPGGTTSTQPNCAQRDYWEPFGEDGAGDGLRLKLLTHRRSPVEGASIPDVIAFEAIEVWYGGQLLKTVATGKALRTSSWVPVRVRYDDDGLYVSHDGRVWIERYQIRGWAPKASWRLGFGSRGAPTSHSLPTRHAEMAAHGEIWGYLAETERHWIDNLHFASGLLVAESAAPVSLSFNGQQFTPSPLEFSYYAMPAVSEISPTSGPLAGGTLVRVRGSKLDAGVESTDSLRLGHRCRYGDVPQLPGIVVNQTTLAVPRVTFDEATDASSCAPYARQYAQADADCYYGAQVVNATYGEEYAMRVYGDASARGTVSCVTPARVDPRTLAIELSLNAQQYTADATP